MTRSPDDRSDHRSTNRRHPLFWAGAVTLTAFTIVPLSAFAGGIRGFGGPERVTLGSAVQVASAAPAAAVAQESESWREARDHRPGFLGVSTTAMGEQLRGHFAAPSHAGVLVTEVTEDSGAWRAGLEAGDVIVSVDGEEIDSSSDLRSVIRRAGADASVRIELVRDRQPLTLDAVLGEARSRHARVHWDGDHDWPDDWTPEEREEFERRMEEFGERMEEWGEELGERIEQAFDDEWADEFERNAEEWGRQMEAWGEEFGRRMEERYGDHDWDHDVDWDHHGDFDAEELEQHMRELEVHLQSMDFDSLAHTIESALTAVDWDRIGRQVEEAVESVEHVDVQVRRDVE